MTEKNKPEPNVLDYVFEHVESFVCQEDAPEPGLLLVEDNELRRDNSLVEADHRGNPTRLQTQRNIIKPPGQDGDMLDYVFEHVESLVCTEDLPDDAFENAPIKTVTPPRHNDMAYRAAKKRLENIYNAEDEDEIQLYFRPERR
jgi:hypothetical protein